MYAGLTRVGFALPCTVPVAALEFRRPCVECTALKERPRMTWVTVGETDIHYMEQGSGQPIVFLHGNSSCAEAWFQQFESFSGPYRCIAYDSVNHGLSSNSPRDVAEPDRADELEGFLAALGIERPILAGNSMGANTILRWAARHPSDAKGLIPSGMGIPRDPEKAVPRAANPLADDVLFLPTGDALTPEFKANQQVMFQRYLRIRSTATRLEAMRHPRSAAPATLDERKTLASKITKVTSPMLIIMGDRDALVPMENAEYLHELLPASRLEVIKGGPHNIYFESVKEYNALLAAFLQSLQ